MVCTGHSHDHEHAAEEVTTFLREHIDFEGVTCRNGEAAAGASSPAESARSILKERERRTSPHPSIRTPVDGDADLILHVPFAEAVTITSVSIRGPAPGGGGGDGTDDATACPRTARLFVNREDVDFDNATELPPAMELELVHPNHEADVAHQVSAAGGGDGDAGGGGDGATIDYPMRPAGRFQNVSSVTIYFPDNFGLEEGMDECRTEISYVGFKGKGTAVTRKAVDAVYEARGMMKDHKAPADEYHSRFGL